MHLDRETSKILLAAGETLCWGRSREGQCDVPAGYSSFVAR